MVSIYAKKFPNTLYQVYITLKSLGGLFVLRTSKCYLVGTLMKQSDGQKSNFTNGNYTRRIDPTFYY